MQNKRLVFFVVFFAVCVIGSYVVRYRMVSNAPPFLIEKLDQLRGNKALMDSIGGFDRYEYSYNKNDLKFRDTVKYSIKITGHGKVLYYEATHLRTAPTSWTLFTAQQTIKSR